MEEVEQEKKIDYFNPISTITMGIPQEHDLLMAYDVYRPALETRKLKSEQHRSIYAEIFIENIKLGPLRDLCTRALASAYTPEQLPFLAEDPLKLRLYYDSLSLDLPLEECYHITDEKYWRRFVLAKNKDCTFAFKKEHEYDWRSLGLSMKFVELVEACPAEYWPDDEMQPMAMKIKDYVSEMHIRRLQSMSERFFRDRIHLDESDETESDSTDVESMTATPRTTESSLDNMGEEEEEEFVEGENAREAVKQNTDFSETYLNTARVQKADHEADDEEEDEWTRFHRDILDERKERTRVLREAQQKRRAVREERRRAREAQKAKTPPPIEEPTPGKINKEFIPKGALDTGVEEPKDDGETLIEDRRYLEHVLKTVKLLDYPMRLCHHVSLRFLCFFENLVNFTIEFRGPDMQHDFHARHLNFSYEDIKGLAFGISFLQKLKIFRLRSSKMDARKLYILAKSLKCLKSIEVIDFGYDHLEDDCGLGLFELFRHTNSIKSLELEHNLMGSQAMHFLAIGISRFGGQLEYLGLAGNPLGDHGLHELATKVLGMHHITHLCLRIAQITESAVICCIANEFLKHTQLQYLDVRTVPLSRQAGIEILKVLQFNQTIKHFDVRDCRLDSDIELDIYIILKRNRYIAENPYLNDPTKSANEIDEYVNRTKNPILLRALHVVKNRVECLKNRPPEFQPTSALLQPDDEQPLEGTKRNKSLDKIIKKTQSKLQLEEVSCTSTTNSEIMQRPPYVYDPSTFTVEEFHEHVSLPGPGERYYYFNASQKLRLSALV